MNPSIWMAVMGDLMGGWVWSESRKGIQAAADPGEEIARDPHGSLWLRNNVISFSPIFVPSFICSFLSSLKHSSTHQALLSGY